MGVVTTTAPGSGGLGAGRAFRPLVRKARRRVSKSPASASAGPGVERVPVVLRRGFQHTHPGASGSASNPRSRQTASAGFRHEPHATAEIIGDAPAPGRFASAVARGPPAPPPRSAARRSATLRFAVAAVEAQEAVAAAFEQAVEA